METVRVVIAKPVAASVAARLLGPGSAGAGVAASAHALLRLLLSELTGIAPQDHVIVRTCRVCGGPHGKPSVLHPSLRVSLSYTATAVAAAVAVGSDVGVDIEQVARTGFVGFTDVALGPAERAHSLRERARAWTRKEAYLKATGVGLRTDPRSVDVRGDVVPGPPTGQLFDVRSPARLACSVAVLTDARPTLTVQSRSLSG